MRRPGRSHSSCPDALEITNVSKTDNHAVVLQILIDLRQELLWPVLQWRQHLLVMRARQLRRHVVRHRTPSIRWLARTSGLDEGVALEARVVELSGLHMVDVGADAHAVADATASNSQHSACLEANGAAHLQLLGVLLVLLIARASVKKRGGRFVQLHGGLSDVVFAATQRDLPLELASLA